MEGWRWLAGVGTWAAAPAAGLKVRVSCKPAQPSPMSRLLAHFRGLSERRFIQFRASKAAVALPAHGHTCLLPPHRTALLQGCCSAAFSSSSCSAALRCWRRAASGTRTRATYCSKTVGAGAGRQRDLRLCLAHLGQAEACDVLHQARSNANIFRLQVHCVAPSHTRFMVLPSAQCSMPA